MAREPVFWGRAGLGWSAEGYILRCPLWVEERALYEHEDELRQLIADALPDHEQVAVGLKPSVLTQTSSSSGAEPGELEIVTPTMITPTEAVAVKQAVTPFLQSAIEVTDRLAEQDRQAADAVKDALRN